MAAGRGRHPLIHRKDSLRRRKQRLSLSPAGAVGDVIDCERVTELIEPGEPFRFVECGRDERQQRATGLEQTRFQKRNQFRAAAHFAVLPRGF
jgi:hypothetical protein